MPFSAASLIYLGGFRTPHEPSTDVTPLPTAYPPAGQTSDGLNFGGRPLAIDLERREFLMGTRYNRVARVQIIEPAFHTHDDVNTFPIAPYVTSAMAELSGHSAQPDPPVQNWSWFEINDTRDSSGVGQGGFLPWGDKILAAGTTYYDANNMQRRTLIASAWPVTSPAADYRPNRSPFVAVGAPTEQGLVAGYFAHVPEAWQVRLKGDVLMGNASLPIVSRGSAGPCAASFRGNDYALDPVPMTLLVGYPSGHEMPEHPWDSPEADDVYNQATVITGMAIVGDTMVFVGTHGYGTPCYGNGTNDPDLAGDIGPDGEVWCYDPSASAKGCHAYPYRVQVWHYPLADLAAVAAGEKAPWDLEPAWFALELPFTQTNPQLNGCTYDPTTKRFYVSAYAADGYGYEPGPVIYVYYYDGDAETVDPPPVDESEQVERLQKTVVALTAALAAERQRHADALHAIEQETEAIAQHTAHILALTDTRGKGRRR